MMTVNAVGVVTEGSDAFHDLNQKPDKPIPNAKIVVRQLPAWFDHYNRLHPHKALGYRSPPDFIADRSTAEDLSGL